MGVRRRLPLSAAPAAYHAHIDCAERRAGVFDRRGARGKFAHRYYRHAAIGKQLGVGTGSRRVAREDNSAVPHLGTLASGSAVDENPGSPPTVEPAPSDYFPFTHKSGMYVSWPAR